MSNDLRELDARIAITLFGWRWYPFTGKAVRGDENKYWLGQPSLPQSHLPKNIQPNERCDGWDLYVPRYSSGWAACGSVLDRLRSDGHTVELSHAADDEFSVVAWIGDEDGVLGKTWQEAICRAALGMYEGGD